MPPQMLCFLDKERNCQEQCVAFCGKDADHPSCVIINCVSVLGIAVSGSLRAEQTKVNHPKSPPPPEVKS
jgi:hypothetical protein